MKTFRFSPGNIWTPLWEHFAESSNNKEAIVQGGKEAQVRDFYLFILQCISKSFSSYTSQVIKKGNSFTVQDILLN